MCPSTTSVLPVSPSEWHVSPKRVLHTLDYRRGAIRSTFVCKSARDPISHRHACRDVFAARAMLSVFFCLLGEMMVHHYYVDHSRQQSSAQSEASDRGNNQQLPFVCSSEVLRGQFFLFGQAVWIICQLLGKTVGSIPEGFLRKGGHPRLLLSCSG